MGLAEGSRAPSFATYSQLALSVNAKLGGTSARLAGAPSAWAPALQGRRLMVLGADLSRGGAELAGRGDEGAGGAAGLGVEYAALVGSWDSHAVKYHASASAQVAGNLDIIIGMQDMMEQQLRHYGRQQQATAASTAGPKGAAQEGRAGVAAALLPEAILMFRDGISQSQFEAALANEFTAIKEACRAVGGERYQPPVTFVVVQKSHGTRIFPVNESGADRSGNIMPGTAVDQDITHPSEFDFYLNSHAGIQGTNRVPRYRVLVDELGLSAESMQLLTFGLAHTYPACNRSVSLPTAVRFADRLAERVRASLGDVAKAQLMQAVAAPQRQAKGAAQQQQQPGSGTGAAGPRHVAVKLGLGDAHFVV